MSSTFITDNIQSKMMFKNMPNLGKYLKWLVLGAIIIFILIAVLLIGLAIVAFQFILNASTGQLPAIGQEGSSLFQQATSWFGAFFPAEQLQLEGIMQKVDGVQQVIQEPNIETAE